MAQLVTRMRELRLDRGLSQGDLAELVGVRRETIVHLEAGRYNPSLKLAWDIARVFGRTVDEVFWYEEQMTETE